MEKDYLETLKNRLKEIDDEIKNRADEKRNIESILHIHLNNNELKDGNNVSNKTSLIVKDNFHEKGNCSWYDYVFDAVKFLKTLGKDEVTANEIVELIHKINPNINGDLIYSTVRNKLIELQKNNKIITIKAPTRREGYKYKIKE